MSRHGSCYLLLRIGKLQTVGARRGVVKAVKQVVALACELVSHRAAYDHSSRFEKPAVGAVKLPANPGYGVLSCAPGAVGNGAREVQGEADASRSLIGKFVAYFADAKGRYGLAAQGVFNRFRQGRQGKGASAYGRVGGRVGPSAKDAFALHIAVGKGRARGGAADRAFSRGAAGGRRIIMGGGGYGFNVAVTAVAGKGALSRGGAGGLPGNDALINMIVVLVLIGLYINRAVKIVNVVVIVTRAHFIYKGMYCQAYHKDGKQEN